MGVSFSYLFLLLTCISILFITVIMLCITKAQHFPVSSSHLRIIYPKYFRQLLTFFLYPNTGNRRPAAFSSRPQNAAFRPGLSRPSQLSFRPSLNRPLSSSQPQRPVPSSRPNASNCRRPCPALYLPVCASDGVSYGNQCEFEASKCRNPGIRVISPGRCGS